MSRILMPDIGERAAVVAVRDHQQTSFVVYIDFLVPDVNNKRRFDVLRHDVVETRCLYPHGGESKPSYGLL
jgi:hypothetical protein